MNTITIQSKQAVIKIFIDTFGEHGFTISESMAEVLSNHVVLSLKEGITDIELLANSVLKKQKNDYEFYQLFAHDEVFRKQVTNKLKRMLDQS